MSETTQQTPQLTERLQTLERKISTRVDSVVRGLHDQIGERVRQASDDVLRWIEDNARELPSTFLEDGDLADVAREITAEHRAIDQALEAMRRIDREVKQADILTALVEEARRFADRSAFFLLKGDVARGWASRGFGERDALAGVELPADETWQALSHGVVALAETAREELARRLDAETASASVLVPFSVRGQIAGALYAERDADDGSQLGIKGLQLIAYAATQALETAAVSPGTSPALLVAGATEEPEGGGDLHVLPAADAADKADAIDADDAAAEPDEDLGSAETELDEAEDALADDARAGEDDFGAQDFGAQDADEAEGAEDIRDDEPSAAAGFALGEPDLVAPVDVAPVDVAPVDPIEPEPPTAPYGGAETTAFESFDDGSDSVVELEPAEAVAEPPLDPVATAAFDAQPEPPEPHFETVDDLSAEPASFGDEADVEAEKPESTFGDDTSPAFSLDREEPTVEVGADAESSAVGEVSPFDPLAEPAPPPAAPEPPDVPDVEVDFDSPADDEFAYDAPPPSADEIADERAPEPELEDSNIWELEDDEPPTDVPVDAPEPPAVDDAPGAFDPQVGQRTVRLDVSQIQQQAQQGIDSEDPTVIGTSAPAPTPPSSAGFASPGHPSSFAEPLPAPTPVAPLPPADPTPPEPASLEPAPPAPEPSAPAPPAPEPPPASSGGTGGGSGGSTEVKPPDDLTGPGLAFAPSQPQAVARDQGDEALHDEARRLARLLVSEIKLYNEEVIEEGRRTGNIYDRLKDDIDRSRQMYEERIDPRLADQEDYFYQELVQRLAGGDEQLLGM